MHVVKTALNKLVSYVERENFRGYDPYDTLNGWLPFHWFGRWGPAVATQIQKRNPINIRPILGIQKDLNPKGIGLFLKAYCYLYQADPQAAYLEKAHMLCDWLIGNYSRGYSGTCWGYNFPWDNSLDYKKRWLPSAVVTSHVVQGLYAYFLLTQSEKAKKAIVSAANYVSRDIPVTRFQEGISFAYTHQSKGACYNASLHAAEILLTAALVNDEQPPKLIEEAVAFVLARQKNDGSWFYSYNPERDSERKQIDFHQGFVLISLYEVYRHTGFLSGEIEQAIAKGLEFYKQKQFLLDGRSLWRLPKRWPVDIHNQAQGIITFSSLQEYHPDYLSFAQTIARWTIRNMQDKSGYFYYRKHRFFIDKTPYIRWSQAWMMLALAYLKLHLDRDGN